MEFVPYVCDLFLTANPMSMYSVPHSCLREHMYLDLFSTGENMCKFRPDEILPPQTRPKIIHLRVKLAPKKTTNFRPTHDMRN